MTERQPSPRESPAPRSPASRGSSGRHGERLGATFEVLGRRVALIDLGAVEGSRSQATLLGQALEEVPAGGAAPALALDIAGDARASGPALALALLRAVGRLDARPGLDSDTAMGAGARPIRPAFVLSVGDAVRRRLPTAARATISAEVPLRRGLVEAQFGGAFGAALAERLDALVVVGGRREDPVVIAVDAAGTVSAAPASDAVRSASSTGERAGAGIHDFGAAAHVLTTGPAADAGVAYANLASIDGDGAPHAPSLVGRGGLGAAVIRQGVLAVLVSCAGGEAPVTLEAEGDEEIRRRLVRSPRLLARASGGTLELAASRDGGSDGPAPDVASAQKHGCRGCPTPCGWQFDLGVRSVTARFSALDGAASDAEGALEFVERCNALGMDARAAGEELAARGHASRSALALDELLADTDPRGGAFHQLAPVARGDLAARVGTALGARGPEPVRSLSVFGLAGAERLASLPGLVLSGDSERDAGALAYWHECFAAAVDISGFCAFSAAGLIADDVVTLDELASWLLPEGLGSIRDAESWLALGARHVARHRAWRRGETPRDRETASGALPLEAIAGYREAERRRLCSARPHADQEGRTSVSSPQDERHSLPRGTVKVRVTGPLARRLAGHPAAAPVESKGDLEIGVPLAGSSVAEVVAALAKACPAADPWLLSASGAVLPGVVRDGTVVDGGTILRADEWIELILVVPGG